MGGRLGKPRGVLPGYSDRPLETERLVFDQPEPETGNNEDAELGKRVPTAFGPCRIYPQQICPGIVDADFVSTRTVERWYVVGHGDYAGSVFINEERATLHPYYFTHALVRPGDTGLPPRRWTNFIRSALGLEVVLPANNGTAMPDFGDWSPEFLLDRPGGAVLLVFRVEHGSVGWVPDLGTNETGWQLEIEWRRTDTNTVASTVIELTETAGSGSPQGRVTQYQIPVALPAGRLTFRMRLVRQHSAGQNNAVERKFSIQVLGQRISESAAVTFPGITTLYLKLTGIPAEDLRDVIDEPVSVQGARFMQDWDDSSVKSTAQNLEFGVCDALVQTLHDAGRSERRYLDVATLRSVQDDLNLLDGGLGGRLQMVITDEMTVEEQVRMLCDHHRLIPWVVGARLSLQRDQRRDPRTLFGARQKVEDAEVETITHRQPDARDAVRIEWFDRARQVERSLVYPDDSPQLSVETIRLPGLGYYEQAWRRARFEWAKISTRRRELEVTLTEEARWLRPGDRIILADSIADPGTYADGWGRLNGSKNNVLVEDPDTSVIATLPGSVVYVRTPDGMAYEVLGASSYFTGPNRIVMSGSMSMDNPPDDAQQPLPFILGDQTGDGGVESNLTWVVATVQDNRDGTVAVTCYDYADVYGGDFAGVPEDPWHDREALESSSTQDDPDP